MIVTQSSMDSRKRIASLISRITDAVGAEITASGGKLTYWEAVAAMNGSMTRIIGGQLKEERDEEEPTNE